MQLFFTENTENEFTISSEESKHITLVLRKKEGDKLNFTDRIGHLLIAEITTSDVRKTRVRVVEKISKEKQHNYYLHIAIAPTKNMDRFEWFLEKSTEIGIDEITPIICDRSERKIVKTERCNRIILSAKRDSLTSSLPIWMLPFSVRSSPRSFITIPISPINLVEPTLAGCSCELSFLAKGS